VPNFWQGSSAATPIASAARAAHKPEAKLTKAELTEFVEGEGVGSDEEMKDGDKCEAEGEDDVAGGRKEDLAEENEAEEEGWEMT